MNTQQMHIDIFENVQRRCLLVLLLTISFFARATDNTIVINSQMPSQEVSVIARQSIILRPGFHASAAEGIFDAKIGNINSAYPSITLAEGSGSIQQPLPTETVTSTGSNIKITTPLQATTDVTTLNGTNSIIGIKYYDGLGRENMTVIKNYNHTGKDIATVVNYDEYGRVSNKWLPTPINTIDKPDANIVMQQAKNYYNDPNPYYTYDPTAINSAKTFKPGAIYRENNKSSQQGIVKSSSLFPVVRRYIIDQDNIILLDMEFALTNIKDPQQTIDEDGHTSIVVTDFNERVILKRTINNGENYDTYYLYDDLGRLCYVLSPEGSDLISTPGTYSRSTINNSGSALAQYAYAYKYDGTGRCVAKKLPGRNWEKFIYDQANQIAFSQDGNQNPSSQWTYYKYDKQGRQIQSGTTTLDDPEDTRATYASIKAEESYVPNSGYTSTKPLGNNTVLLLQQFYDSYNFLSLPTYANVANNLNYNGSKELKYSNIVDGGVDIALLGKLTGSSVAMLDDVSSVMVTTMYYDVQGHIIQKNSSNLLGGYDKDTYTYNFAGMLLTNMHNHSTTTTNITEFYKIKYDRVGRITSMRHKLNDQPEIVMDSLMYDEIGRATRKILHGGIQSIDYVYTLQGQLKSMSSPVFSETLFYNDDPNTTPLFNGSIASIRYGNGSGYKFSYDGLNRLKSAEYTDLTNPNNNGAFDEIIDQYDKNGNILKLTRSGLARDQFNMTNGVAPIVKQNLDQLTISFAGNQIQTVSDNNNTAQYISVGMADFIDVQDAANGSDYKYDANGNCIADLNKGIAWTSYNLLNRPQTVQMTNGNKTSYSYDATGQKRHAAYYWAPNGLQVPLGDTDKELGKTYGTISSYSTTDYCGRYVYVDGVLTRILTPEGYVQVTGSNSANWRYAYNLTDHLGGSRAQLLSEPLSNATSKTYTVVSTTEYYPMGMEIRRSDANSSGTNPYLYGGNEMERMHGMNLYEFPYRWYDYAVPGFTTPDPLAEKHYSESPYSYCGGDPVNRVDPTGLDWYVSQDKGWAVCVSPTKAFNLGSTFHGSDGRQYEWTRERLIKGSGGVEYVLGEYPECNIQIAYPNIIVQPSNGVKPPNRSSLNSKIAISYEFGKVIISKDINDSYKICNLTAREPVPDALSTPQVMLSTEGIVMPEISESTLNRVFGAVQLAGGTLEAVAGGVGGVLTAETGVGAVAGYLILLNGIDNMQTGARQLWTGQTQETMLHQGTRSVARAAGASNSTAEMIATGVDYSTIFLGSAGSAKALYSPYKGAKVVDEVVDVVDDATKESSVLFNTSRQLQAKFKHAGDFGVLGNYSKANAGKFSSAINQHINSAGIQIINGTYRGQSVIHYLNPNTGLNVISNPAGQFISGWKLNPAQLQNVLKHGGL